MAIADGEQPQTRTFTQFVQDARRGGLHGDLTEHMQELVRAVQEHRKSGSLTLTLKVGPGQAPGSVIVADELKLKVPEADKDVSLFFPDEHGNLHRSDPRQLEFDGPLRQLPGGRDGGAKPREGTA